MLKKIIAFSFIYYDYFSISIEVSNSYTNNFFISSTKNLKDPVGSTEMIINNSMNFYIKRTKDKVIYLTFKK